MKGLKKNDSCQTLAKKTKSIGFFIESQEKLIETLFFRNIQIKLKSTYNFI